MASIKTFFGGEVKGYTTRIKKLTTKAVASLIQQAHFHKADAIVAVRFNIVSFPIRKFSIVVVNAYGTSVRFIEDAQQDKEFDAHQLSPQEPCPRELPEDNPKLSGFSPGAPEELPELCGKKRAGFNYRRPMPTGRRVNVGEVGVGSLSKNG